MRHGQSALNVRDLTPTSGRVTLLAEQVCRKERQCVFLTRFSRGSRHVRRGVLRHAVRHRAQRGGRRERDQGRHPPLAQRHDGDQRGDRARTPSCWRSRRSTRPAACSARRSMPVVEDGASDWPTFAEKASKLISAGQGRHRVRRLDLGEPQGDAAGLREQQGAAVVPGPVRGPGELAVHLLHRRHHQPADHPRPRLPQGAGQEEDLPGRQRLRLPAHRQQDHQGATPRRTAWRSWARSTPRSATPSTPRWSTRSSQAKPDAVFNTLNGD